MKCFKTWLCALVALAFIQSVAFAQTTYAPGEVLVKFQDGPTTQAATNAHAQVGSVVLDTLPSIGWQRVRIAAGKTVEQAIAEYKSMAGIVEAQPNYTGRKLLRLPNDPRYTSGEMYGLNKIGAPAAWDVTTGSANVVVADFDGGINAGHEDLAPNLWVNPGESGTDGQGRDKSTNGLDDDGNGFVDDVNGIDVAGDQYDATNEKSIGPDDGNPNDNGGHGSHTAGTIGASGNNGKGIVGVSWNVRIMAIRIFGGPSTFPAYGGAYRDDYAVARAFDYVVAMKNRGVNVRVANHSWGGGPTSLILFNAFKKAQDVGILNVIAAGNEYGNNNDINPFYPASFDLPGAIVVAASNQTDDLPDFTNYGPTSVDLAAPGESILSTVNGGPSAYAVYRGTSMATPHVTGAAALLLAAKPSLSLSELKSLILDNVDVLPQWSGKVLTNGRLNLAKAMAVIETVPPTATITSPRNNSFATAFSTVTGTAQDNAGGSGIDRVELNLFQYSSGLWWNGSSFVTAGAVKPPLATTYNAANNTYASASPLPSGTALTSGLYRFRATAFDKAGNASVVRVVDITIDKTGPSLTVDVPANGATVSDLPQVNGTVQDNSGGIGVRYIYFTLRRLSDNAAWDGSKWIPNPYNAPALYASYAASSGTWLRNRGLPRGSSLTNGVSYRIRAVARDRLNNSSAVAQSDFTVQTTTGTSSVQTPSTVALSTAGSSVAASTVTLTFTGALDATVASDASLYIVIVNDTPIVVTGASLNASGNTVTLTLPAGTLSAGDSVEVSWYGLSDALNRLLSDGSWTGAAS